MNGNERKIMDNNLLQSRDYYIDLINSSKANKMTALYHYSGVGFKKAKLNQGIYRKSDDMLVGVLQWGCSAQEGIRLDRYVKEEIKKEEYLELNGSRKIVQIFDFWFHMLDAKRVIMVIFTKQQTGSIWDILLVMDFGF